MFSVEVSLFEIYQKNKDPIKLPRIANNRDASIVLATPNVITLAIQCWNPQNINNGTPKRMPKGVFSWYSFTAIYIIAPQKNAFKKNDNEKLQVFTFSMATGIKLLSVILNNNPSK